MSRNVAASVRARLLNQAKQSGGDFQRVLTRYAIERFLYRLGMCNARDRCILKGASLLTVWLHDPYRATRDVDVLLTGNAGDIAIVSLIEEICAAECLEDGLRFDLSELTVQTIRPQEKYSGKRARFHAYLGASVSTVHLDLGVGDALTVPPVEIIYPTMLDGLPEPRLRAYPREATVAEKFEAMVTLDTRNSRMKDFHDVWALAGAFDFDGRTLRRAVAACFERRRTPWTDEVPRVLTPGFYQLSEMEPRWRAYLAAGSVMTRPPDQFEIIGEGIVAFIRPIRDSIVSDVDFDYAWSAGGQWSRIVWETAIR